MEYNNDISENIVLKINNIIEDDDNPFMLNYYDKIIKIRDLLKNKDIKLCLKKYYNYNKNIEKLNNLLNYGWSEDDFGDILDDYIIKLYYKI